MRVLSIDEYMEKMRKCLSEKTKRPVLIISSKISNDSDCVYREQNEIDYRKRYSLEMSLAQLTDNGHCVERIDYPELIAKYGTKIPAYSIRKFDLSQAAKLYFAVPVMSFNDFSKDIMKCINVATNSGLTFKLSQNEIVPEELKPFVQEITSPHRSSSKFRGIQFITSCEFIRPDVLQSKWHLGEVENNIQTYKGEEIPDTGYTRIHAPGKYSSTNEQSSSNEEWSQMIVCKREPGRCIVCHGSSKEKNHFGPKTFGLICKACLPKACREWVQIVNQF